MHPLIKVPAVVGTVITVALLVAGAFAQSHVPWLVSAGTGAVTILGVASQLITVQQKPEVGQVPPPAAPPAQQTGMSR